MEMRYTVGLTSVPWDGVDFWCTGWDMSLEMEGESKLPRFFWDTIFSN